MDTVFAQAVIMVSEMPLNTQRFIGEALLDSAVQPDLPVIEFTAEENAKLDEALTEVEAGEVGSQEDAQAYFEMLRKRAYAAL